MSTNSSTFAEISELIHDEQLMAFVQEKAWNYESQADFMAGPMPCGLDPDTAWELVSFVRRMGGWPPVRSQMPRAGKPLAPGLAFQTMPPAVEQAISDLAARCDKYSQLWKILEPLVQHRRIVAPLAEDLAAAAEREGFSLSYETVRALALGTREPQGAEERIVANTAALLRKPHEVTGAPTAEMLCDLHAAIVEGADALGGAGGADAASANPPGNIAPESSRPEAFVLRRVDFEELAREIGREGQWGAHPLPGIIMNAGILWNGMTVGPANAFLEIVLRRRALMRIGLPVLAWVPLSWLRLSWERGRAPELMEPFGYGEAFLVSKFGLDCTPYLIQMLAMMEHYIDRLEEETRALTAADTARREAVNPDARLSHRQKELLADLIADPAARTDVGAYARHFDCAVSTARDDLNRLVNLRYCSTAYQGKKQVFWLNETD